MKRLVALGMTLAMLLLAGCGTTSSSTSSPVSSTGGSSSGAEEVSKIDFPNKQIEIIVPLPATGGDSDTSAMYIANALEEELGVTVIITNVGGGSTTIGMQQLKDSDPDGYTIAYETSNLSLARANNFADMGYEDFEPIAGYCYNSSSLMIRGDETRFTDFEGMLAYAKEHPGELSICTGSGGGMWHLAIMDLVAKTGMDVNVIADPKGGGGSALMLLNGEVDAICVSIGQRITYIESGEIKDILSLGRERFANRPDVPTAIELGYDVYTESMRGFVAPKGTPAEVIDILEEAIKSAIEKPECDEVLTSVGLEKAFYTSEEFTEVLKEESVKYPAMLEQFT